MYFTNKDLPLFRRLPLHDKRLSPLDLATEIREPEAPEDQMKVLRKEWKTKPLHGRYYNNLHQPEADIVASVNYLTEGYLFAETEGSLFAIQDQVVPTRNYRKYILKEALDNTKCRLCNRQEESIQHIISACTYLAPTYYLERHNNIAKVLHAELSLKFGLTHKSKPYHTYSPESVKENNDVKMYWDLPIITDRAIAHNRPDILLFNKIENKVLLLDISVPLDENVGKAYREKVLKYSELGDEIKRMWQVAGVRTIPIIISANGIVHRSLKQHLQEMNLPASVIIHMQKYAVLGTTSIVRKVISH